MIILVIAIVLFILGGMVAGYDIRSDNESHFRKIFGVSILFLATVFIFISSFTVKEELNSRYEKSLIKESMGETKYQILSKEDGFFKVLLTESNQVIFIEIEVKATAGKPEKDKK